MLNAYLTQTATWKRLTGYGPDGPIYAETVIKVRWEGKRRLVRDRQGAEVVSEGRVYCVEAVRAGDVLTYGGRDWPVISVSEVPTLDGRVLWREVAV